MLTVAPFLQLTCLLVVGIVLHELIPMQGINSGWLGIGVGVSVLLFSYLYRLKKWRYLMWLLSSTMCFLGYGVASFQTQEKKRVEEITSRPYQAYLAVIKSLPEKRTSTYRYEVEVTDLRQDTSWHKLYTRALIQTPIDSVSPLQVGTVIQVNHVLKKPFSANNPGSFDYANYLEKQGILYVDYLRAGQWLVLDTIPPRYNLVGYSYSLSEQADRLFKQYLPDEDVYGLVKAMILGRRDDLRSELVDAFTIAGAVHILSVSGLHVGIFFIVLQQLLGFLRRYPYGNYLQLVILVGLLVVYGFMTGMPASVERSVIMCLLFAAASTFERNQVPLNTLGIAALLILLLDPLALYSIGFQLSFLAMVGLIVFSKPIENVWKPSNRLLRYVWGMMAATLAAQLTTLPLTLYYFHQFPTWFLLINPLVIAISSILLPAAFLLLIVHYLSIEFITEAVAWVVQLSAQLTNYFVEIPLHLPFSVIDNIAFDGFQTLIAYAALLLVAWLGISRPHRHVMVGSLFMIILLSTYTLYKDINSQQQRQLVVHSFQKKTGISILEKGELFVFLASPISELEYRYTLKEYKAKNRIRKMQYVYPGQMVTTPNWQVEWGESTRKIAYYDYVLSTQMPEHLDVDQHYYWMPLSARQSVNEINTNVILAGSVSYRQRQDILATLADTKGINVHDIQKEGALVLKP